MRRLERVITDRGELLRIAKKSEYAVMSMADGDRPYAVPMNVIYEGEYFYAHCADNGKKLTVLKANPNVVLTFVTDTAVVNAKTGVACDLTMHYRSVCVTGTADIITQNSDPAAHLHALDCFGARYGLSAIPAGAPVLARTTVIRILPRMLTGKKNTG